MKGLTIRAPWWWAILHSGRRIENRSGWWRGPWLKDARRMLHEQFVIHANSGPHSRHGANYEEDSATVELLGQRRPPPFHDLPHGAIVGRATLRDIVRVGTTGHRYDLDGRKCLACGEAEEPEPGPCSWTDPWAFPGALGLVLADVVRLVEPIQHKGALGFFEVSDAILANAQWEKCS